MCRAMSAAAVGRARSSAFPRIVEIFSRVASIDTLSAAVESMLATPEKISTMRAKALERARPTAAADIARHILRLIDREQTRR